MSNYLSKAIRPTPMGRKPKNPKPVELEPVEMLDNYYGSHRYGVQFPDGKVYPEEKCTFEVTNDK